ncbi:Rv3654c family TadE-like protein [Amnibacterium kyonggiense]
MSHREGGAGTALAVAVIAAIVLVFVLAAGAALVLDARRRVVAAADAAALAGADVALGDATGSPCGRAAELAAAAGVRLDRCDQRGVLVRVRASTAVLGIGVVADALAGPPPAR